MWQRKGKLCASTGKLAFTKPTKNPNPKILSFPYTPVTFRRSMATVHNFNYYSRSAKIHFSSDTVKKVTNRGTRSCDKS